MALFGRRGKGLGSAPALPPDLLAVGALLVLVALFNPGLVFFGHVLGGYDTFVYFYPLRTYLAVALQDGHLPLWNPYLFAGTPYLANPQTAVFYPGSWLFAILDVPRAYALNFVGHMAVAAAGMYAFVRLSLGLGPVAGIVAGAAFAFSGFMNGQAGHINQFSVAAWLPAVALFLDLAIRAGRPLAFAVLVAGLTMQILAGHPQEVYMTAVALGVLALWRAVPRGGWAVVRGLAILGGSAALAAGISAVQLLPTFELSRLSIRGGGLSYLVASFDALPWPLLLPALLPGYWAQLPTTEFFAHTGTTLFACAWLGLVGGERRAALLGALYVTLGLVLAVGDATFVYRLLFDWAPGFSSFRVPARWIFVATFGMAILTAAGTDWLVDAVRARRFAERTLLERIAPVRLVLAGVVVLLALASLVVLGQPQSRWHLLVWGLLVMAAIGLAGVILLGRRFRLPALVVLVIGALADLWVAGANLEHRQTIPNVAYGQWREGIAALIASGGREAPHRSLSIATPEYLVKETEEYEQRFGSLGRLALDNLLVTIKWNETLWPNVPLDYGLPSADGYDGGVLPLRNFYSFARAMLGEERARPDGVLASRLDTLPQARWLDLLGVRWVLASRAKDVTRGAIVYDRAISVSLGPGQRLTLAALPGGEFTRIGMISTVEGPAVRGDPVGSLRLVAAPVAIGEIPLLVGQQTAPSAWKAEDAPNLDRVHGWSGSPEGPADWIAEIGFPRQAVTRFEIANTSATSTLIVRSLNLIDDQRQVAFPLVLDDRVVRTDFFDVKLYDRRDTLSRAYLAGASTVLDDAAAARRLGDPSYTPRSEVLLAPSPTARAVPTPAGAAPTEQPVLFEANEPEYVRFRLKVPREQYAVLSDSWYPGWRAFVDGVEAPIERANLVFRAVRLDSGEHVVEFRYEPGWLRIGWVVSAVSLALAALLWGAFALRWRPNRPRGNL